LPQNAIELRSISKLFRVYPDLVRSRIKQYSLFWKKYYTEQVALRGINLSVKKGEVVGVIGPNGAGKTTMLKIIAGISRPSSGEVFCSGRVIAVQALGLGFHPRLTGLENMVLAGMMLGMSKKEIQRKKEWIIDFSEVQKYIDKPLTSYSMGMRARLSFAVAACQTPEILIIDEALATGDIRFVQKCIRRIHEIVQSGTTALFVSHNIWSIKKLTHRCILLDQGEIVDDGDTGRVTDNYYEVMLQSEVLEGTSKEYYSPSFVGTGEVQLKEIRLLDQEGRSCEIVHSGEPTKFVLEVESDRARSNVLFSLQCWRSDGVPAFSTEMAGGALDQNHDFCRRTFNLQKGKSTIVVKFPSLLLAPGDFVVNLSIIDDAKHSGYTSKEQLFFKTRVLEFGVRRHKNPNRSMVYYQPAQVYIAK
jgi:ABC-type polysaccharide/polyol phosphate transport system ATPase subunit